ncbi:MAG: hypothetical protein CL858_26565 [Cupriavidus sp.]|jgi:Na+-transporting methylmalonyl-CoA/oxaloacetate decarboxylase gamma subunit|uniref:hypothetical protein n=1 Tax=Cupriavidus pauculus TaxID=82633 RepID=UPI0007867901|nr:hypothetical protein [Cupriavidus pauculus]MBU68965.1 hypothetical protein [Cupriavidus sp.]KAB0602065.1 hypothetical protein F7R19_14820 [Cupriavidus pauculus]MBY4730729.1 hypothetical protein [Cupriavidus pauculus]MCM3608516.1 hypothetical protein [Cupriavidus pauculus]UAK99997.1 hypothetical protein K8O84_01050 [Cupriavidus pauculus]
MLPRKLVGLLMLLMLTGCMSRQVNHLLPPAPEPPRMSPDQAAEPRDAVQVLAPTTGATAVSRAPVSP